MFIGGSDARERGRGETDRQLLHHNEAIWGLLGPQLSRSLHISQATSARFYSPG